MDQRVFLNLAALFLPSHEELNTVHRPSRGWSRVPCLRGARKIVRQPEATIPMLYVSFPYTMDSIAVHVSCAPCALEPAIIHSPASPVQCPDLGTLGAWIRETTPVGRVPFAHFRVFVLNGNHTRCSSNIQGFDPFLHQKSKTSECHCKVNEEDPG